jgi:hypothetical protein
MNWPLIVLEIVIALATFHLLHGLKAYEKQSKLMQILIGAVILFVLFTLLRFLWPGVSAL